MLTKIRGEISTLCENFLFPQAGSGSTLSKPILKSRVPNTALLISSRSQCLWNVKLISTKLWWDPADFFFVAKVDLMHRILIADDNDANRELLEAYLIKIECETETSIDGQETKLKASSLTLVLLDVMMPKLSGFEVCKQIKDNPETKRIMVLMVTALNELGDIERAVNSGTDDFLSKPVNRVELTKRVKHAQTQRHRR